MNLGAEPKKIATLGVLLAAGGYVFYTNVLAGPDVDTKKTPSVTLPTSGKSTTPPPNIKRARVAVRGASQEFRPKLIFRADERPNYATIDPTLRLDLLAKVQEVEPASAGAHVRTGASAQTGSPGGAPASSSDYAEVLRLLDSQS
jgi:hypothetical protein